MKRLLVICYEFPPGGGAGVKRTLKFVKFFSRYGWHSSVLAVRNGRYHILDESLLGEVPPDVPCFRAVTLEPDLEGRAKTSTSSAAGSLTTTQHPRKRRPSLLRRAYRSIGALIKAPDSRILWVPAAVAVGWRAVRREGVDVIYASGPSFANFLVGALLKRLCGKPLVIDFRDAWTADPVMQSSCRPYLLRIHMAQERFVIRNASVVIATNPRVTRDFQDRYPECPASKFRTIYNGYDPDDFAGLRELKPPDSGKFTIVYTGRLYAERSPKSFLHALSLALKQEPEMQQDTRVIFVGSCERYLDGKMIEDYIREYDLAGVVELTGQVSRRESLEYQNLADLLLLIVGIVPPEGRFTYGISGKVFDYLVSQKPVVTLADDGATREFVTEAGLGEVLYHEDVSAIRDYLIRAYRTFRDGGPQRQRDVGAYRRFDFRSLTKELCSCLDGVLEGG